MGGYRMWVYTDKVKELFDNPKNVGEVDDPDGTGEVGSLSCGDALKLTFKLDGDGRIEEARFQTFGCASAIASSSALTEMIIGKTLDEAETITNQDIVEYLGGLPDKKMHCSVMGQEALRAAIADYRGQKLPKEDSDIVCECFGVTQKEIEEAVHDNKLTTLEQVTDYTKAGGGCGSCHERIETILQQILGQTGPTLAPEPPAKPKLSNVKKMKLIEETLEQEIQPTLAKDGGSIELVDIIGDKVLVALKGTCATCAASEVTLKHYVEGKLRELVEDTLVVEEVTQ
jgi:NifU-like protein